MTAASSCGVHPFGRRVGNHMLPDDVRKLRDHLSKLLMEPEPEDGTPVDWQAHPGGRSPRVEKHRSDARSAGRSFGLSSSSGSLQGVLGRLA
jgi:hypothetical protein